MLNAVVIYNFVQYLALYWNKTRNRTPQKAFQIPDFSLTLCKTPLYEAQIQFCAVNINAELCC